MGAVPLVDTRAVSAQKSTSRGDVLAARLVGGEKQIRQASGMTKTSLDASQKGLWPFVIDSKERPDIFLAELEAQ